MDGIAAITSRITEIQSTVRALNPQPTAKSSAGAFDSVLATEVTKSSGTTGVDPTALRVRQVGAYGSEQLTNAAAIIKAGQKMGLSVRDQTIGVMTAIGESSLRVVDHGDAAGPDSRGLFQQRANGAWGSYADRMSPAVSATSFFTALAGVQGRDSVSPTLVAHTVQRNADAQYYTKYWDDAVAIVSSLAGGS
ncbi:MAG: hypothetical protein ACOH17_09440 [Cellulomonas sp.]